MTSKRLVCATHTRIYSRLSECIDWVQDTLKERARRKQELYEHATAAKPPSTYAGWFTAVLHAAQSWFVVALVGAVIGINAALISIITAWLSDIKQGHCSAGWWLNQKFCCWEIESGGVLNGGSSEAGCEEWLAWSDWSIITWFVYVFYAVSQETTYCLLL